MRRITIAIGTTLTGLALLFSWPTSLNRSTVAASSGGAAGGTTSGTTSSGTTTGGTADGTTAGSGAAADSGTTSGSGTTADSGTTAPASATYDGDSVSTRWGNVQVRITVADGAVTAAEAIDYPRENGRDQQINAYAIPVLNSEAVAGQSANIAMVSGATVTSGGYLKSLQSALDQAGL